MGLYLQREKEPGAERISLEHSPLLVGRHPHADIRIDSKTVNRRHAAVVWHTTGWVVYDLQSVNGVRHNGKRVSRAELNPGDRLKIGQAVYSVVSDQPGDGAAEGPARASSVENDETAPTQRCRLEFFLNNEPFKVATINRDTVLGYASRCHVQLPNQNISSLHALLVWDRGVWYLHDLRSDQGTTLNQMSAASEALEDGDVVEIGAFRIVVHLGGDWEPTQPVEEIDTTTISSVDLETDELLDATEEEEEGQSDPEISVLGATANDARVEELAMLGERAVRDGLLPDAIRLYTEACAAAPFVLRHRKRLRELQGQAVGHGPEKGASGTGLRLFRLQMKTRNAYNRGDLLQTLELAEAGLTQDPWNKRLLLFQARVFERFNRLEHCVWTLMCARRRDPLDPAFNRPLARIMHHVGEFDNSIRFWKLVAKARPSDRDIDRRIKESMVQKTIVRGKLSAMETAIRQIMRENESQ